MRIGYNPNKDKEREGLDFYHQVIIPIHIPEMKGYFKESFIIFKYSFASLQKTCHSNTFFTIANNGSCEEVVDYLDTLYRENQIHEIIHTSPIGKLNAVLKGIIGHRFPVVTVTDADVLFTPNWQKGCYDIFSAFPKAGAICTTPSSKVLKLNTSSIIMEKLFSKNLKFTKVINPKARQHFADSIGKPNLNNEVHLTHNLTIENSDVRAVVGASHFVATYRGDLFDSGLMRYTNFSLGGTSEREILDSPIDKKGFWRLSTEENYTFHMGNIVEPWMEEMINSINEKPIELTEPVFNKEKKNSFILKIRRLVFLRLVLRGPVWKLFLQYKGLSKMASEVY